LQYLHDLINVDQSAPAFEAGVGDNKFVAGQVAMFAAGHWPLPEIISSGMENVGVQNMPINKVKATVFGIGGLSITKASQNQELAWEFIKEMTGKEYQKELADSGRSIPSARSFATAPDYIAFPDNAGLFYETAATAIPVPAPPNFAQVEEIFMRHFGAYMTENQDLDTTITQLDTELSRAMARAYN
jgi:multiple sugar transport system substrate-binding protein